MLVNYDSLVNKISSVLRALTLKKDLLAFPEEVIDDIGYALGVVQPGGTPPSARPWKGEGPGVYQHGEEQYEVDL